MQTSYPLYISQLFEFFKTNLVLRGTVVFYLRLIQYLKRTLVASMNLSSAKILGFVLTIFLHSKGVKSNSESSFMISFQTSDKDTTEEWAEYKEKMPSLKEFTICTWFKMQYFTEDRSCLWG